jgi:hypothetical protein
VITKFASAYEQTVVCPMFLGGATEPFRLEFNQRTLGNEAGLKRYVTELIPFVLCWGQQESLDAAFSTPIKSNGLVE